MVSHHIDPYTYGTGILGSTPFSSLPDSVWTNTPSPYGPTFLAIDGALDTASGHKVLPDILLLRLLEVASLALIIAATPALARRLGRDPAQAVLLGAGCPLVLITLIGGAHNEALMLGLLMAGLVVAMRWGTVPGVVLCAVAAGVKSPALLGVVFLGWAWAGTGASSGAADVPHRRSMSDRAVDLAVDLVGHRQRMGLAPDHDGSQQIVHCRDARQCDLEGFGGPGERCGRAFLRTGSARRS